MTLQDEKSNFSIWKSKHFDRAPKVMYYFWAPVIYFVDYNVYNFREY